MAALVAPPQGAFRSLLSHEAQAATRVDHRFLKIEDEDTLSEALDRHFPCRGWRLWGKRGAVAKVSALNPQIRDINQLRRGMLIDVGEYANTPACEERAPASIQEPGVDQAPENESKPELGIEPDANNSEEPLPPAKDSTERYGLLQVMPEFSFSRIESTDRSTGGSAIFSSNLIPGVSLSWGQHWSNSFQTSLSLGVRSESYVAPAGYTLENSSRIMTDFGFGVRWIPTQGLSNLAIDSNIDFRQETFARAISLTSVRLDATMIPELSAGIGYRVLDLSPFTLTLLAQGLILFSQNASNYNVQSGAGSSFGITMTEDLSKKTRLTGGLHYSTRSQDTSIATQTRTDVGIGIGITYRLDWALRHENVGSGDMP